MQILVHGKSHLKGVSKKTGNPYDFIQVHYLGRAYGVDGEAGLTLALDPMQHPLSSITVGGYYDVEFDNRGRPIAFVPVTQED